MWDASEDEPTEVGGSWEEQNWEAVPPGYQEWLAQQMKGKPAPNLQHLSPDLTSAVGWRAVDRDTIKEKAAILFQDKFGHVSF